MQKRPITKLVFLSLITLGFYEVIWLSETRKEMVSKLGLNIPSAKIVGIVYWFQWVSVLLALVSLSIFISQENNISALPPVTQPSRECFINYVNGNGPGASPTS